MKIKILICMSSFMLGIYGMGRQGEFNHNVQKQQDKFGKKSKKKIQYSVTCPQKDCKVVFTANKKPFLITAILQHIYSKSYNEEIYKNTKKYTEENILIDQGMLRIKCPLCMQALEEISDISKLTRDLVEHQFTTPLHNPFVFARITSHVNNKAHSLFRRNKS